MIKIDALRTRNSVFDEGNKEYLILLLTFYCKRKGISYKQGLNEVLAPFVYFRNSNLTLSKIFNYFSIFVDKYLINFYADEVKIRNYSECLKVIRNLSPFKYVSTSSTFYWNIMILIYAIIWKLMESHQKYMLSLGF